eukprot:scaffold308800_cov43-Tisochrysis_lutea.AAC.1
MQAKKDAKGYFKGYAQALKPPLRVCTCEEEREARDECGVEDARVPLLRLRDAPAALGAQMGQ